jgi:uncharacterized phage-like protein YoqJ
VVYFLGYKMCKKCGLIGNNIIPDYLDRYLYEYIIKLILGDNVKIFLITGRGAYSQLAVSILLKLQEEFPKIEIWLFFSFDANLDEMSIRSLKKIFSKVVIPERYFENDCLLNSYNFMVNIVI